MSSNTAHPKFRQELVEMIPRLRRFAYGLTGSAADGDDLVQTTLERAINHQHQLKEAKGLYGWVFSILRSMWKNELRSRSVRRGNGLVSADQLTDQSTATCHETQQMRQHLHDKVMALPENFRSVLILIDVEGLTYEEAAAALDIPRGTLMSRLARARNKLIADSPSEEETRQNPTGNMAQLMTESAR